MWWVGRMEENALVGSGNATRHPIWILAMRIRGAQISLREIN
jgi:hypothetical protein